MVAWSRYRSNHPAARLSHSHCLVHAKRSYLIYITILMNRCRIQSFAGDISRYFYYPARVLVSAHPSDPIRLSRRETRTAALRDRSRGRSKKKITLRAMTFFFFYIVFRSRGCTRRCNRFRETNDAKFTRVSPDRNLELDSFSIISVGVNVKYSNVAFVFHTYIPIFSSL